MTDCRGVTWRVNYGEIAVAVTSSGGVISEYLG